MRFNTGLFSLVLLFFTTYRILKPDNSPLERFQDSIIITEECDTITTRHLLKLVETLYIRIDSFQNLSGFEQKKMIRVYNTLFLLSNIKNKSSRIFEFQNRFDTVMKNVLFENKELVITKHSSIYFPNLNISVINMLLVKTKNYNCSDIYCIYDK